MSRGGVLQGGDAAEQGAELRCWRSGRETENDLSELRKEIGLLGGENVWSFHAIKTSWMLVRLHHVAERKGWLTRESVVEVTRVLIYRKLKLFNQKVKLSPKCATILQK